MLFMDRIADSFVETFFHAIPGINCFDLKFLFIECFICNDQIIAPVLYIHDIALSLETVYRDVSHELVYFKVPARDQILFLGPS